jgi:twinkle protein
VEKSPKASGTFNPIDTTISALTARGITEDTMRKCDYRLGKLWDGTPVHVQLIKDEQGKLIDQKTRTRDKQFKWLGGSVYKNNGGIIGEWSWPAKGKTVVITEGEIDRMTVSQVFDNKYPTGSLPNGSGSVKKALLASWEKLLRFDHIVLCFDNDEPGQKALKEACDLLPVGRVKIMSVPGKDANATLLEDGPAPIIRAYWDARPFRPDGIREGREFTRENLKKAMGKRKGLDLPYPKLNGMWMGLRPAEITTLCAGSGIGKSTLARAIAYHMRVAHGEKIGNIYLEEDNETSVAAYCALHAGVPLKSLIANPSHISDDQWDAALEAVIHDNMMFYDHFGSLESDRLLTMMRYFAASGCKFIVLDHISIVVSGLETMDERKDIDVLMTKLASFVKETGVGVIAIVHLKRSNGKDFNGGDQISLNDLRGSASLEQLSFNVLALERDQQNEEEKLYAQIRSLKCRITGETGEADLLKWNIAKGCYEVATRSKEIPDFDPHEKGDDDIKF